MFAKLSSQWVLRNRPRLDHACILPDRYSEKMAALRVTRCAARHAVQRSAARFRNQWFPPAWPKRKMQTDHQRAARGALPQARLPVGRDEEYRNSSPPLRRGRSPTAAVRRRLGETRRWDEAAARTRP